MEGERQRQAERQETRANPSNAKVEKRRHRGGHWGHSKKELGRWWWGGARRDPDAAEAPGDRGRDGGCLQERRGWKGQEQAVFTPPSRRPVRALQGVVLPPMFPVTGGLC